MIRVFYHIYTSTHRILSMSFVDQQLRRIYVSQLHKYAELNCVIVGPWHQEAQELVLRYGPWNILESRPDDPEQWGECRTLRHLWQRTQEQDAVLYMHTKGISYASGEKNVAGLTLPRNLKAINSWRWAMEHYNIDRWVERFNRFRQNYSEVQGSFLNHAPYMNYVGNFWWSMGGHIRRLDDPTLPPNMPWRDRARRWLFSVPPTYLCDFHVLDKPRDDGVNIYGTFRVHEDDCMPYIIQDQSTQPWPPLTPQHLL